MKKKYLLLSFVLVCALAVLNTSKVSSNKTFPPVGSCGDPTSNVTCIQSGCHGGTSNAVTAQDLVIKIGVDSATSVPMTSSFQYVPGQQYFVNFDITAPGYAFGFQTTALDASNNPAGTFAITPSTHTKLLAGYVSHLVAAQGINSWSFTWTAPSTNIGPVTFYYAFNPADSADFGGYLNAVPSNNIFVGSTTIQAHGVGINEIVANISALEVYPNPVSTAFNLSFNAKAAANVTASLYTVDGRLCKSLFSEHVNTGDNSRIIDMASLPAGIYMVKLNVDGATITKKIVKE